MLQQARDSDEVMLDSVFDLITIIKVTVLRLGVRSSLKVSLLKADSRMQIFP